MPTGNDIVIQAFKKSGLLGLGQAMDASDLADGLTDLNDMISQWRRKRWLIYHLLDVSVVSDGRSTPYTVGPTGDIVVGNRPAKIAMGYVEQIVGGGLNVSKELTLIPAREQYARISLKSLVSYPRALYYDPDWPQSNSGLGNLFSYPWPNASMYKLHILVPEVLKAVTAAGAVVLPDEYFAALKFNLARRLRQAYGKGKQPDTELNALAEDALSIITNENTALPEMNLPRILLRPTRYNIYSDSNY